MQTKLYETEMIIDSDDNKKNDQAESTNQNEENLLEPSNTKRIKTILLNSEDFTSADPSTIPDKNSSQKFSVNLKAIGLTAEAACYKKILKLAEKQNKKTSIDIVSEIKKELLTVKSQRSLSICSEDISSIKFGLNEEQPLAKTHM
jgi:hypothetical protein